MARFMVKASEFKNVCKAVNDRQLESLKKEIIEILKKQDEKEFKKAINLFESQEMHYTHLEKSIAGKWIQKAGYGVGTVRIWKGKKYKKIAPGKWARVFDKEGRGTNIAIGKLIARVQKIDNIEDLMAFVMQNKQRFVDENGIDLPVLDKLRAAVDAKNNGGMRSKLPDPKDDNSVAEYKKQIKDKVKEYNMNYEKYLENQIAGAERHNVTENELKALKELQVELKGTSKPAEKKDETKEVPFGGVDKNDEGEGVEALSMADKINEVAEKGQLKVGNTTYKVDKDGKEWAVRTEIMNAIKCKEGIDRINDEFEKKAKPKLEAELKEKLDKIKEKLPEIVKEGKLEENKKLVDERLKRYSEYADEGTTVNDVISKYKNKLINKLEKHVKDNELFTSKNETDIELLSDIDHQVELCSINTSAVFYAECKKLLDEYSEEESEAEKTQNRSEAMKGNQNAKKYGLTDEQIERYDIQEVVEDVNGRGIVRNSEGKYSYIEDGRVKDRPEDFEEKIEKVRDRIDASYQTQLNIEAAKAYDFKNADFGEGVQYFKMPDEKYRGERHRYFKKAPNSTKGLSVIVEISNMREPLNMTYEVYDAKTGESWEYDASYGNKEGLEWAVERPEQMEKELKKFFKRDPEKEWNKQNTTDSITNFESEGKVVSYDELKPIATNKSVGENEVQMPYSKDLADEIESLKNCAAPEWENREFMKHVYYDDGNLVTTDGRRLKIVKVGKLDGIQDGTYVDITTDKSGINIKKREGMEDYKFPTYKKVMPDNLSQNVTLDSKLVKEKIKAMQKDGAIDKKGANIVQLEFRDGKVFIDDTAVGDAKDIQLKTSEGWNDPKEDTNYVHFNADYLTNALSGKTAVLQMGEDNHKAMAINTGSTSNVLMPMHGLNAKMDYSSNRSVKAAENEAKDKKKADNRKHSEQLIKDLNEEKIKESIENVAKDIDRQCETSDDDFLRSAYEKLNFNFDKILDKKRYITVHDKVNKDGLTFISAYMHSRLAKEHPEVKEKIAAELEKRGISVKKSLFDDFIVDMFVEEDEEEEPEEENESLFNDYSAEQPDLFNSTEMKVQEAYNRCGCCL